MARGWLTCAREGYIISTYYHESQTSSGPLFTRVRSWLGSGWGPGRRCWRILSAEPGEAGRFLTRNCWESGSGPGLGYWHWSTIATGSQSSCISLLISYIPWFLAVVFTKTLLGFPLKGRTSLTTLLEPLWFGLGSGIFARRNVGEKITSVIGSIARYNVCREETYLF